MAVQGVKGSGIGQVTIPSAEEYLRRREGYVSGIGQAAAPYMQGLIEGEGPMAERYMPSLGPAEEFRKKVGLPPATTRSEQLGDFVANIPLYGLEGVRRATGVIGDAPAIIGDFLASPTDAAMADIISKEAAGIESELSPFREQARRMGQTVPEMADKSIAKSLADISKDLGADATDDARAARKLAEESGTTITDAIAATEAADATTDTTIDTTDDARATVTKGALTDDTDTGGAGDAFEGILKQAMDGVAAARGEKPKMTLEEYKQEFADATGVNIEGKVDKSQALMALGLSLMQNKAGRDFNVSNALAAIGEAGEKAMPEFAKAKEVARNAKIAAGKYGLQQLAADKAAQATKIAAAQEVVDDLLKSQLDSVEAAKLEGTKHLLKMKQLEYENDAKVSVAEIEAGGKPTEFGSVMKLEDKAGLPGFITRKARNKHDNKNYLMAPEDEIVTFGDALSDVNEALNAGATMTKAIEEAMRAPGGITGERAIELFNGWGRSIGMGINLDEEPIFETRERTVKDENGVERTEEYQVMTGMKKNPTPLSGLKQADAIRDRLISQFKRFLTQETGNGISNVDIANIERLLGKANFLDDPADALFRLQETMKIFDSKRQKLNNRLEIYMDKDAYRTEDEYNKSMDKMNRAISLGYNLPENIFSDLGADNVTIDPASGLQVFKMY